MSAIALENKTILVTGAAGFIGSNLVKRICEEVPSAKVVGIDSVNDYYDVALKEFRLNTQGAMFRVCQLYFSTQTAMTAHIALTPLKSAAVRHGINAIVADIYNVAAAYDNSLADTQKILLRQSR